jgi:hypothetical protein
MRWRLMIACATVTLGVSRTAGASELAVAKLVGIRPGWTSSHEAADSDDTPPRLVLTSEQSSEPGVQRAETGVSWSLGDHVAVQVSYERTARAPLKRGDHDDGVLTRLRLGF